MPYVDSILRVGGVAFDIDGILDGELNIKGAVRHVKLDTRNIRLYPELSTDHHEALCLPFSYDSSLGEIDIEARALWGERLEGRKGVINPQRGIDSRVVSYIRDNIQVHFKISTTKLKPVNWPYIVIHESFISQNFRERAVELFRREVECYKIPLFSVKISGKDFDASLGFISAKEYLQMERQEKKDRRKEKTGRNPVVLDTVGGYERWEHNDALYRGTKD